jgi:hypothetical protein
MRFCRKLPAATCDIQEYIWVYPATNSAIIDRRLHARRLPDQRTEAQAECKILKRTTTLGMLMSIRIR